MGGDLTTRGGDVTYRPENLPGLGRGGTLGRIPPDAWEWFERSQAVYGGGGGKIPISAIPRAWLGDPRYAGFLSWLGVLPPPGEGLPPVGYGEAPPPPPPPPPPDLPEVAGREEASPQDQDSTTDAQAPVGGDWGGYFGEDFGEMAERGQGEDQEGDEEDREEGPDMGFFF